jgi:hypothetical protein
MSKSKGGAHTIMHLAASAPRSEGTATVSTKNANLGWKLRTKNEGVQEEAKVPARYYYIEKGE